MMKVKKPKKRVIFYWFVDYGFFFLIASLFSITTFLKYSTTYYALTLYFFELTIIVLIVSLIYLIYKWIKTEYIFLKKHLVIKKEDNAELIPYDNIKKTGYFGNLLQHLMGTTNIKIETSKKNFYLNGIKDYKKLEKEIFKRKMKEL